MTYHKIDSVFMRDPATKMKTFLMGQFARPEFEYLQGSRWVWTEKIDGTNIRVMWDGIGVKFGGRTDEALIPAKLIEHLSATFTPEKMLAVFGDKGGITLYGEGFGAGIQKGGGNYSATQRFILFDITGGPIWFEHAKVREYSWLLEIPVVEVVRNGNIADAVQFVRNGFESAFGVFQAEGIVLRPQVELCDRMGRRIITKLKCKDFAAPLLAATAPGEE